MSNIDLKNGIDDFYNNHFKSIPKMQENENRDKILLNTILAEAEKKRIEIKKTAESKSFFSKLLDSVSNNFQINNYKFVTAVASIVVIANVSILVFNNSQDAKVDANKVNLSQKSQVNTPSSTQETKEEPNSTILNENSIASNSQDNQAITTNELNPISYNFAERNDNDKEFSIEETSQLVIKIVSEILNDNNIKFKVKDYQIETNWYQENEKEKKLTFIADSKSESVKILQTERKKQNGSNLKTIKTKNILQDIENNLYKYLNIR